jgi:hypothetical protein
MSLEKFNLGGGKTKERAKKLVDETKFREARGTSDTVKVWENYREQAMLWRALALLQIPATFMALLFGLTMWFDADVYLNVPAKPLEGHYQADEIQDVEFFSAATEFLNLVATYQPSNAERQFREAAKYLQEPFLGRFQEEIITNELVTIVSTRRSQVFFVDPARTKINRMANNRVQVQMTGERQKWVAGEGLPAQMIEYTIILTTVPRNTLNPYGIMVSEFSLKQIEY